jgi:sugar/nucleoside kinase (ribokinase family)
MKEPSKFVVAGHLCLDLTPAITGPGFPQPGKLTTAGPLQISLGGAVPNVGFALQRLGHSVRLVGLVGDDWLGEVIVRQMQPLGAQPGIRTVTGQASSYSLVIASPERDRAFVHCAGVNAAFTSADVQATDLNGAVWLHFGYPPVMPAIMAAKGRELAKLFRAARKRGLRTSLDLCSMNAIASKLDWGAVLRNCSRFVTVFAPSIDELRIALKRPPKPEREIGDVSELACKLLDIGFPVVAIKLGSMGLYLATTDNLADLRASGLTSAWRARELLAPCFKSHFVNASGAGDCTIAGLISAIAAGENAEAAVTTAVAAGASSVEAADASSGVRSTEELKLRIRQGWERLDSMPPNNSWIRDSSYGLWTTGMQSSDRNINC